MVVHQTQDLTKKCTQRLVFLSVFPDPESHRIYMQRLVFLSAFPDIESHRKYQQRNVLHVCVHCLFGSSHAEN